MSAEQREDHTGRGHGRGQQHLQLVADASHKGVAMTQSVQHRPGQLQGNRILCGGDGSARRARTRSRGEGAQNILWLLQKKGSVFFCFDTF